MTPNASAHTAHAAHTAHTAHAAHVAAQEAEVDDLAATAAFLPSLKSAKTGTATDAPSFQITGLVISESRKIDPSQRKRRKRPDEVDDDELVPEEDPIIAIPAPKPVDTSPYPYALDGSPLPQPLPKPLPQPLPKPLPQPLPSMTSPQPVIPLAAGRVQPMQQPRPPQTLAPLEGELPDDEDLPRQRSKGAVFMLAALLLINLVVFGVSLGNNGIFHFGDIGGSFSAAMGGAPMEIKPQPLPAPPEVPGLIALGDDQDQPDLRIMLSPPTVVAALNGDKVLVVYGQATNRARESLEEVIIEGTLHDLQGGVVAKSLSCPLLPLYGKDASVKGLAARDAQRVVANAMSRDSLLRIWGERTMADPQDLRVDGGEVAGFLLVFPSISEPISDQTLVEISVLQARRALSSN